MRFRELQHSFLGRVRNPAYWVVLLSLGALAVSFITMVIPDHGLRILLRLLVFVVLWLPATLLSPAPWQWTGDDRSLAPWGRGLLQSCGYILLVAVCHGLLVLLLHGQGNVAFVLGLITGLAVVALFFLVPMGVLIARGERLSLEAREAQVRARQAQWMGHRGAFSPRLLFGNLDHLAGLAHGDPRGTEQGLVDLAALYRQWLMEAEKPVITLGAELRMAEQYLALERKRWKECLQIRTHFDLEQEAQAVPPLLLLSFLEQALTGSPTESVVEMEIQVSGTSSWLEIRMEARGPIPAPSLETLAQSRRRIQAALNREGSAILVPSEAGWTLTLRIPKRALETSPCS